MIDSVLILAWIFCLVAMFYSGYSRGYKAGHIDTLAVYTKHMLEVRQRVSVSAWEEINSAYRIMYERQQNELLRDKSKK